MFKSFDSVVAGRKSMVDKHKEMHERNGETIRKYSEGISKIKKIDLHEAFRKDGKTKLMDVYHDELQMNKWRDSCIRQRQNLKDKVLSFEN